MIKINYHREFIKEFKKLPDNIRSKLVSLEEIFREDPFGSSIYIKKLKGKLSSFFSFRVTRDYRVIFRFVSKDEVDFLSVRHRKDIYLKI